VLVNVPFLGDILRGFPGLGLSPQIASLGIGMALLLGLLAGFIPSILAYRARITEALRQV
jgi:ABC-type antimicrobial peptide transport system permease subunit